MGKMIYDLKDNKMGRKLNDYQVMDMDGHVHNVQPIDDHMMMDIKDGSLHYVINEDAPENRRKVKEENEYSDDPEYASAAMKVELIAIAVVIVLLLIFYFLVIAD